MDWATRATGGGAESGRQGRARETKPSSQRPRIKAIALLMTPWCWVIGTGSLMAWKGEVFPRAAALGAVSAFGGLLLWLTYHFVSGRNDGFGAFITGLVVLNSTHRHGHGSLQAELGRSLFVLMILVMAHVILGLWLRPREKAAPHPLADPEADAAG